MTEFVRQGKAAGCRCWPWRGREGARSDGTQSALLLGVPCLIRADDGVCTTGRDSRRGGLGGGPGFPP